MKIIKSMLCATSLIACLAALAFAAVPQTINYQGYLKDANGPVSTTTSITFSLYNQATGGDMLWQETMNVTPQNGIYSVQLGTQTPISSSLDNGPALYLGIKIGSENELPERHALTSVPFALRAELPVSTTVASSTNGFEITNSDSGTAIKGTGGSGNYGTLGGQNGVVGSSVTSGSAILGISNGAGSAIEGYSSGTGRAGFFNIVNDQNTSTALAAQTNGSGDAIQGASTGAGSAIWARSLGTGRAGLFTIENAANSNPAIAASTNGSGDALQGAVSGSGSAVLGRSFGTGRAGTFTIENDASSNSAVYASTNGTGSAGRFYTTNSAANWSTLYAASNGGNYALEVSQYGTGYGAYFLGNNATNPFSVIFVDAKNSGTGISVNVSGTGMAASFNQQNTQSNALTLYTSNQGSGGVINASSFGAGSTAVADFSVNNASAGQSVLSAMTNGTGKAGDFRITNGNSTSPVLEVTQVGKGNALQASTSGVDANTASFSVNNAANPYNALYAYHQGSGAAIQGNNSGSGSAALFNVSSSGNTSTAVTINNAGQGFGLDVTATGSGTAGRFRAYNAASGGAALIAHSIGTGTTIQSQSAGTSGSAGIFSVDQTTNSSNVFISFNHGLGKAGQFTNNNALNINPALVANTLGAGEAVYGTSTSGIALRGESTNGYAVQGTSTNSVGVVGTSTNNTAIWGIAGAGTAVDGLSTSGAGVIGRSSSGNGVRGTTGDNIAVYGINNSSSVPAIEGWNTGGGDIFRGWSGGSPALKFTVANNGNATFAGSVTANGTLLTSDRRLKTDIQPLENSLKKVLQLRGVSYVMKEDENKNRKIGVIAQEVEQEFPELVATDPQGMKSVAYANLTAVLIEAVKGLKAENDALRSRVEKLEKAQTKH